VWRAGSRTVCPAQTMLTATAMQEMLNQ